MTHPGGTSQAGGGLKVVCGLESFIVPPVLKT